MFLLLILVIFHNVTLVLYISLWMLSLNKDGDDDDENNYVVLIILFGLVTPSTYLNIKLNAPDSRRVKRFEDGA